ncbi:unnamed protein product [Cyclocybe aegerita]|uniref:Proteasome assembly chaperone 2 n=1 Tax=Cyclocybe aegerita TaxID=1973307 RepID=A0A8S0WY09_CYCAE|nr:unnamed protein product [Cyclocybe aegerita]
MTADLGARRASICPEPPFNALFNIRMPFIYPTSQLSLERKTPVVSTANVGQLAVDLIIASLSLQRVAILESGYCVPVVGAREDGQKGITTALELYGHPGVDFVVIQQRSPVLKVGAYSLVCLDARSALRLQSRKEEFIKALLNFIKDSKFGAVLFLSGVDLSNRTDSQMTTPTYQIRPENSPTLAGTALQRLSSLPIPKYTSPVSQEAQPAESSSSTPFIPGGGITRRILSSLPSEWSVPTASILQFVLEGDNRADAGLLASVVVKILGKEVPQWRQPGSWRDGLFGTPHDQTLFG